MPLKQEKTLKASADKAKTIAEAVNFTRDLVNGPNNYINPETMAEIARKLAKDNKYKVTIMEQKQLEKLNMGGILSVNKGSKIAARLVILEHKPAKLAKDEKPIVIVGKGVTFDSGGYNLKPTSAITNMKEGHGWSRSCFWTIQSARKTQYSKTCYWSNSTHGKYDWVTRYGCE